MEVLKIGILKNDLRMKFLRSKFENGDFEKTFENESFENWNLKTSILEVYLRVKFFIKIKFLTLKNEELRGPNTWPIGVYPKQTKAQSNRKKKYMPSNL